MILKVIKSRNLNREYKHYDLKKFWQDNTNLFNSFNRLPPMRAGYERKQKKNDHEWYQSWLNNEKQRMSQKLNLEHPQTSKTSIKTRPIRVIEEFLKFPISLRFSFDE